MSCARCGYGVYKTDEFISLNKVWHKCCFTCYQCDKRLEKECAKIFQGELFCQCCYSCVIEKLFEVISTPSVIKPCKVLSTPSCTISKSFVQCLRKRENCCPKKIDCYKSKQFCFPAEKKNCKIAYSCSCLPIQQNYKNEYCFDFPIPREVANYYSRSHMKSNACKNPVSCCTTRPCPACNVQKSDRCCEPKCNQVAVKTLKSCCCGSCEPCLSYSSSCDPSVPCQTCQCCQETVCPTRKLPCRPSCSPPPCSHPVQPCCCKKTPKCCQQYQNNVCPLKVCCEPSICCCQKQKCSQQTRCCSLKNVCPILQDCCCQQPKRCTPQRVCVLPPKCPPLQCCPVRMEGCCKPSTACESKKSPCNPCRPPKYCVCGNLNPCDCKISQIKAQCTACCNRCGYKVYAAEKISVSCGAYHTSCFTCSCCNKCLDVKNVYEGCGEIYCKSCYNHFFGTEYYGFGNIS
ncbi:keratin-associated protein 10-7-like isoform X2 [Anthonomus grandis grandis]|uniref:keratin-associated protein 10-7-like isoform X2 n=1 Tax=Anthonomus grandis grandis TaxID=2921223 RepID=UPI00216664FC|nr:keratin-associated protein 10-7-like isoform X2 [Anthonomus grandis grandis]